MTHYLKTITKEEVSLLEAEEFNGRIILITTQEEAVKAVDYLMQFPRLGFDTETRPSFTKGMQNKIALMQIATGDTCFLFRLNSIGIPPALESLLKSNRVLKVGLSLRDDFGAIRQRKNIRLANFIDLQIIVHKFGIEDLSLQKNICHPVSKENIQKPAADQLGS